MRRMTPSASFQQFADAVSTAYPNLSPQQQVIAQYVLEHPDELALGTAATVAEAAGVQPSALVRFANVMNFSGFSQLQRLFRNRLLERAGTYRERISAMKAPATGAKSAAPTLQPFVELGMADLKQLAQTVGDATLRQAASLLCGATRVHVLACAEDTKRTPALVKLRQKLQGELKAYKAMTACVRGGRVELWGWAVTPQERDFASGLAKKHGLDQVDSHVELLSEDEL